MRTRSSSKGLDLAKAEVNKAKNNFKRIDHACFMAYIKLFPKPDGKSVVNKYLPPQETEDVDFHSLWGRTTDGMCVFYAPWMCMDKSVLNDNDYKYVWMDLPSALQMCGTSEILLKKDWPFHWL